jgi:hypothetical protein
VISDWSEARHEQAESVSNYFWWGQAPNNPKSVGALATPTYFSPLLLLRTCRAVTLRGPRLGAILNVSGEIVSDRSQTDGVAERHQSRITDHCSLLFDFRERHRIQQELLVLRPMLFRPFLTGFFPG